MGGGFHRRGQTAASAAILVAIIGGLLVVYLLFLPAGEREAILFGEEGGGGAPPPGPYYGSGGVFTQTGPLMLLTATPGTLRLVKSPIVEHSVPSATIFTAIHTQEIKSIDSAIVKNGVFAKQGFELEFDANRRSSNNYLLSFNVDQAGSAPLRVSINGRVIYERPIRQSSPPPVPLPIDYFVDGKNVITLETGGIGMAFWKSNTYFLSNILLSADLIDISGSVSEQTFSLPEDEMNSMESARLQFVPECDPKNAGRLTVQLNSRFVRGVENETLEVPNTLYTGFVDCGILFKTDVPKEYLMLGQNHLLFASQGGQYVVDRIKFISQLRENDYPTYYFNLPPDMYDVIDLGQGVVRLTMVFTDFRTAKRGEVVINGFVQSFETPDVTYQALVDPAILTPGPNTIQIIPHVDKVDLREMRVELI